MDNEVIIVNGFDGDDEFRDADFADSDYEYDHTEVDSDDGFYSDEEDLDAPPPTFYVFECEDCFALLPYSTCSHNCPGEPERDDRGFDDIAYLLFFIDWHNRAWNSPFLRFLTVPTGDPWFL